MKLKSKYQAEKERKYQTFTLIIYCQDQPVLEGESVLGRWWLEVLVVYMYSARGPAVVE